MQVCEAISPRSGHVVLDKKRMQKKAEKLKQMELLLLSTRHAHAETGEVFVPYSWSLLRAEIYKFNKHIRSFRRGDSTGTFSYRILLWRLLNTCALTRASATAASTSVPVFRIRMALTEAEIRAWCDSRSGIETEPRSVEGRPERLGATQARACSLAAGHDALHFQLSENVAFVWKEK